MHKHVHSKATYPLRVHQFTTPQGCEGGKKGMNFIHHTNLILSMHKHVYSKATYPLRVHQFTTQQVEKKVIGGMNFHSSHKTQSSVCTNMFIQRQFTHYECTSSQHNKWVNEVKEGTDFHSTQNPILGMHKHGSSEETYCLKVHQGTTQQVKKTKKK